MKKREGWNARRNRKTGDKVNRMVMHFATICLVFAMALVMLPKNARAEEESPLVTPDGNWNYEEIEGGIHLTKYIGDTDVEELTVPAQVEEQPVIRMESLTEPAYNGSCKSLVNVVLPSTLVELPDALFSGCAKLKSVTSDTGEFPDMKKIGKSCFGFCSALETFEIPSSLEVIEGFAFINCESYSADIVTNAILNGDWVFANSGIKSITIQNETPFTLGKSVFVGCSNLTDVSVGNVEGLPSGTFKNMNALKTVTINAGLTNIPEECFYGDKNLETVHIPDTVATIGKDAFSGCSSLNIELDLTSVKNVGESAFIGCRSIQKVVCSNETAMIHLGKCAFYNCTGLQSFPFASVVEYGDEAFGNCGSITEVIVNDEVKELNRGLFLECKNLETVSISATSKLEKIGQEAFKKCENLTSLRLPETLRCMDDFAIDGCNKLREFVCDSLPNIEYFGYSGLYNSDIYKCCELKEDESYILGKTVLLSYVQQAISSRTSTDFTVPEGIRVIAGNAFLNVKVNSVQLPSTLLSIGTYAFSGKSIESIELPEGLLILGYRTFSGCDQLKEIVIPDSVVILGGEYGELFSGCTNLQSVHLPNHLAEIKKGLFKDCTALTEVNIPDTLKILGEEAFLNCENLTSVKLPEGLETIERKAFSGCDSMKELEVPASVMTLPFDLNGLTGGSSIETLIVHENSPAHAWADQKATDVAVIYENKNGVRVTIEDGEATVVGYVGNPKKIDIPSKVAGAVVTNVAANAIDAGECESISIPDSVTSIDENAFVGLKDTCTIVASKDSYAAQWAGEQGVFVQSTKKVERIEIIEDSLYLVSSNTETYVQAHAMVYPKDATELAIEWSVSDPDELEVTYDGRVRLKKNISPVSKEYVLTATAVDGSGVSGTCKIVASELANGIIINKITLKDATVAVGKTVGLTPEFEPTYATVKGLNWASSDESIAIVKGGVVTGLKDGIITITATSAYDDSVYGTCEVIVGKGNAKDPSNKDEIDDGSGKDDPTTGGGSESGNGTGGGNNSDGTITTPTDDAKNIVGKVKSFKLTAKKKALKLTWKKMSGIKGYQIQVSTKKNFKKKYTKKYNAKASAKSKTIKKLKAKKKYFVRIRAYKKIGSKTVYGAWVKASKKTK